MTIKELYELAIKRNAENYTIISSEWGNIEKDEIEWNDKDKYINI